MTATYRFRQGRALVAAGILAGCTGLVEGDGPGAGEPAPLPAPGPAGAAGPPPAGPAAPAVAACAQVQAAPAPLRRLTRAEYNNTVRDLLGETSRPGDAFVADGVAAGFESNADAPVTVGIAHDYLAAAEKIAARAVGRLDTLLPCRTQDEACARQFVATFGKRAFRRPLREAEVSRLLKVYAAARARGSDFPGALRVVITAVLQSASFLNHIERGVAQASGPVVPLTPFEVASRLSYLLWGSMPDDALFAAAEAGRLSTAAGVEAEARRMLQDPRARAALLRFFQQWLEMDKLEGLQKNRTIFPAFSSSLGGHMKRESEAFVSHVLWSGDARLETLLTATFSFVNAPLARIYGLQGVEGDSLRRAELDPAERAGLLTHPGFLAAHSYVDQTAPVHRGKFVRERLFCQVTPSPPPDVDTTLPPTNAKMTTRQRYAQHLETALCAGCHRLMNPIGLGMEKYDGIGQFRTTENGLPIDATGEIVGTRDSDGLFDGVPDLARRLARSAQVHECMAGQWFGFATGSFDTSATECQVTRLGAEFMRSGGNLRDLVLAIVKSDGFRHRPAFTREACR